MRIGIFNRWLHTRGGGERHTGAAAQALAADGHKVTFITTTPTDLAGLEKRLNLDLADRCAWCRTSPTLRLQRFPRITTSSSTARTWTQSRAAPPLASSSFTFPVLATYRHCSLTRKLDMGCTHVRRRFDEGFYGNETVGDGWYRAMTAAPVSLCLAGTGYDY